MQKITPFLWFEKSAEEAMNFYISVFDNPASPAGQSKVISLRRYPTTPQAEPWKGLEGKVLTEVFELEGQKFMALDGGPYFKFNPSVSFFINCKTVEEVESFYKKLSPNGFVMMPLQKYPFSEMYAWVQDKFGVSWQINAALSEQKIIPSFLFVGENHGRAEEAINFYTSIFKNSKINTISRYEEGEGGEVGKIKYASFDLEGQKFNMMESNLDHKFTTTGAISQFVECTTQEEVDYYWERLSEGGNAEAQQCGWLQDKFGFSWQVVPTILTKYLNDQDTEKSDRVMQAMLKMKKIDIKGLEEAYNKIV